MPHERHQGNQPRQGIRAPGTAGFSCGSFLFQKGVNHVLGILDSTVDLGLFHSVAARGTKPCTFAAFDPAPL